MTHVVQRAARSVLVLILPAGLTVFCLAGELQSAEQVPAAVRIPPVEETWQQPPVIFGRQKQLFVDDYVITHRHNVHRELNPARKANGGRPLLVREKPWEVANLFQVATVWHDGTKFVMHYGYAGPVDYCLRAESQDGLEWSRPALGLKDFPGARDNNLLDYQGYVAFHDDHERDPAHRFKAAFRPLESSSLPHAACLAHSADGFRWTAYNDGRPVTGRAADTLSQLAWDEQAQLYRLFTRTDFGEAGGPNEYRGAREMINPDVTRDPTAWRTVRNWIFDREGPSEVRRRQIHTVNFWQHEGIDFGLMTVMEWPAYNERPRPVGSDTARHETDVWNCYLATRRGGHEAEWDLTWIYAGKPLISRGEPGAFDKDLIHPAATVVTWNDAHWIYYTGWPNGHMRHPYQPAIGLATVERDRFVSLEPWVRDEPAWIVTPPFVVEGQAFEFNADLRDGRMRIEILDEVGAPLDGFRREECEELHHVNGLRLSAKWKDQRDLTPLAGKTVRLRIEWERGRLFAFQVRG